MKVNQFEVNRMKKIIGFIMLCLFITPGLAATEPAKTEKPADAKKVLQGDFQVFKLGDTRKQVIRKIQEYVNDGKIDFLPGEGNQIILKQDNLPVTFRYQKNKLYMISILYETGYKGLNDRQEIVEFLKDLLTKSYGQPVVDNGYPATTESAQTYLCVNWVLTGKEVDIVVHTDYRNYQEVTVEIYDMQVRTAVDKDLVKDFG
jgi:hypothetical protein